MNVELLFSDNFVQAYRAARRGLPVVAHVKFEVQPLSSAEPMPIGGVLRALGAAREVLHPILDADVERLGLGIRALAAIRGLGVKKVKDLTARTAAELLAVRNIGPATLNEIREALAQHQLHLSGE